jgi:hypothetical protein
MGGTIIEFRRHRGLGRGRLGAGKPLPRDRSRQFRLEQQVARISALLEELEDMDLGSQDLPLSLIVQAQAGIRKAGDILRSAPGQPHCVQDEPDPQPFIDREVLERMYRSLDPQR